MYLPRLLAGSFFTALFLLPALCPAQSISIISGDGQVICPDCAYATAALDSIPMVVQVNNSSGQAMANTTVTWTSTQTGFTPVTATSVTNSVGQATCNFSVSTSSQGTCTLVSLVPINGMVLQATVVASAGTASVTLYASTAPPNSAGTPNVKPYVQSTVSEAPPALSGQVGQTATPITVGVIGPIGPLENIAVSLVPSSATGPGVSCAPQSGASAGAGIVLTNSSGIATCTPLFNGKIGTGTYNLEVGGIDSWTESLTVTAGPPALITYVQGNNQSLNPGQLAPLALEAEVTDLGKNPSENAAVTWTVSPSGSATLSGQITDTPATGLVSARVTATGPGPISVTVALASNPSVKYTFTINVNTVVTALQAISGTGQQAIAGAAFTDPLIVQVNDNGTAISGVVVEFSVASGSALLSAAPSTGSTTTTGTTPSCSTTVCGAVTNSAGQAEVMVTAGTTTGPVVITAAASGYSVSFNLTVNPKGPVITSVLNAAGFSQAPNAASPCSLVTIYGTGLAPDIQGVADAYITPQNQVAGVTVTFAGIPAPILYVANINGTQSASVQVPCNAAAFSQTAPTSTSTSVPLVVTVDGTASTAYNVPIYQWSPGIFQFVDSDGQTRAVLIRPDGSVASVTNPVRLGETVRMFATGLGETTPSLSTGEIDPLTTDSNGNLVPMLLPISTDILVGVNGGGVEVVGAEYAFFGVGVYEIDFVVPSNTPAGNNVTLDIVMYDKPVIVFGNASQFAVQ